MLQATLEGIATEATIKAAFYTAEAIAYAVLEEWDKMATASAAAAAYALAAGAAGAASTGMAGAGHSQYSPSGSAGGPASPTQPSTIGTAVTDERPIIVEVYLDTGSRVGNLLAQAESRVWS